MITVPDVVADDIDAAVAALRRGGVVAYPTEAVFGIGCDPLCEAAVRRVFDIKQRPAFQGVLLIAADFDALGSYIDLGATPASAIERARASWPGPHTWVFPRAAAVPPWIAGSHAGIAVRVTAHPVAARLCRAFGGALVSTSANRHGTEPSRDIDELRATLGPELDAIVGGPLGGLERPTPIRDAISGEIWRA